MVWENPKSVERAIKRVTRQLDELDRFLYRQNEEADRVLYASSLQQKREDVIRATVLHMHTAIENLVTEALFDWTLGTPRGRSYKKMRTKRGQTLARMLGGPGSLGFDMKMNFAVVVGVITPQMRDKLRELNTLRNKCSHNWLLEMPVRRGRKPQQVKVPLLSFRGRDLHKMEALREFMSEFGHLYNLIYGIVTKEERMAAAQAPSSK